MLRSSRLLFASLALLSITACVKLNRQNPYDPESPEPMQAKATIVGFVTLEGDRAAAGVTVVAQAARSGPARREETATAEDGSFLLEIAADVYNVEISAPTFTTVRIPGISLLPGEQYDVGGIGLVAAKGAIRGSVLLEGGPARDTSPAADAQCILVHESGGTYVTACGADGAFRVDGMRAGKYTVRCTKRDYAPGYTSDAVEVEGEKTADAPPITLFPASAVVQAVVSGVVGARYTNSQMIDVQLLAFVERLKDMRVSEDSTFTDATLGDVSYRDFAATIAFALSGAEGAHTIYAQFRDDKGLASDVFSTTITLDRTPPDIIALKVADGGAFARTGLVPVEIRTNDLGSGLHGYSLILGMDFTGAVETSALAAAGGATINSSIDLGADGMKTVSVRAVDRAGNVSTVSTASLRKDSIAPTTTPPALRVNLASGGTVTVHDLRVSLAFNVNGDRVGEPLYVALAHASGLDASSPKTTLATPQLYDLLDVGDGQQTICALFSDAAGNATQEICQQVNLDTTGGLHGTVSLEGGGSPASISVTLEPSANPLAGQTVMTNGAGAFTFTGMPAGDGYVLRMVKGGFETRVEQDVSVVAGGDPDRGNYLLALARGTLTGVAKFQDKVGNNHAGITISDPTKPQHATVTGPDGSWTLDRIPIGTYTVQASAEDYISQSYTAHALVGNETFALNGGTALQLAKAVGDFKICTAADVACNTRVLYTKDVAVNLGLGFPGATGYWKANTAVMPGGPATSCGGGCASFAVAHAIDGTGPDGPRSVYIWYDTAGGPTAMFSSSVTLDTTPPTGGSVLIDGTALYTNNAAALVTLTLSASDAHSGMGNMTISNEDTTFNGADTTAAYATTVSPHLLQATEGLRTVCVQYCDAVGNCVAPLSAACDTITLDRVAPSSGSGVTFSINGGNPDTTNPNVTLNMLAGDAVAARFGVTPSLTAVSYVALDVGANAYPFTLTAGDGAAKRVYAQFKDAAGNETTPGTFFDEIALDTQAPTAPFVSIDQGVATNDPDLTFQHTASGAAWVMTHVGPTADFTSEVWSLYAPTGAKTISTVEADYTLHVKFKDAAGNESAVVSDTITFDVTAPQLPTMAIDLAPWTDGIKYSSSATVTLAMTAVGADFMTLAPDGTISSETPEAFAALKSVAVIPATAGTRTVAAQFSDRAGNTTAIMTDSVKVDFTAPAITTFSASPSSPVSTTSLTLTIAASDASPIEMMISNDAGYAGASWRPIESPINWDLTATPGAKSIYLKLRDPAGNVAVVSPLSTTLDQTAPVITSVSLASGADYVTNTSPVAIVVSVSDNLSSAGNLVIHASEDPTFATYTTLASASTTFTLSSGEGLKAVYVRVRDEAGNYGYGSDTITRDTQAPFGEGLTIEATGAAAPAVAGYAKATTPIIATFAAQGASEYCLLGNIVEADATCNAVSAGWLPFVGSRTLTLLNTGLAQKDITVRYRDAAKLTSNAVTKSVILDESAPTNAVGAPQLTLTGTDRSGASTTVTRLAQVTGTINGAGFVDAVTTVYEMQVSESSAFFGAVWQPYATSFSVPLTFGDGTKTIYVRARDRSGNVSSAISGTILLDTTPPDLSFTVQGEGAGGAVTTSTSRRRDVSLSLDVNDHSGSGVSASNTLMIDYDSAFSTAAWQAYSAAPAWNLVTASTLTCHQRLVINELETGAGATSDWVELFNASDMTIDVAGWTFECGNDATSVTWTFPSLSLPPDVTLVIQEGGAGTLTGNGAAGFLYQPATACPWGGANGYGILRDRFNNPVDFVRFNGSTKAAPAGTSWSEPAALTGATNISRGRVASSTFDRDTSADFCLTAPPGASKGVVNGATCGLLAVDCQNINGPKIVYVKVRDLAGNESEAVASTYLDVTPPAAFLTINDNDLYTTDRTFDLRIAGIDVDTGVTQMMLSQDPATLTSWEAYVATTTYTVSAVDGSRWVGVRLRDAAGNETPVLFAPDTITLDTTPPNVSIAAMLLTGQDLNGSSNSLTRHAEVDVTIANVTDNLPPPTGYQIADMKISEDNSFSGVDWVPFGGVATFTLSSGDASKTVYAKFRDYAGNESSNISASITLDQTPPQTAYVYLDDDDSGGEQDATYTKTSGVRLRFWLDDTDAVQFRVLGDATPEPFTACSGGSCSSSSVLPETEPIDLSTTIEGVKNVHVQFRDAAGNTSTLFSDQIFLDTRAPGSQSAPAGKPVITGATVRTTSIFIDFVSPNDPGAPFTGSGVSSYEVQVDNENSFTPPLSSTTTMTTTSGWVTGLPSLDLYYFRVRAVDAAGNTSDWSSTFESQVGLTTAIMENANGIGKLKGRLHAYRGLLMVSSAGGPTQGILNTCDVRRDRCRDAGFDQVTFASGGGIEDVGMTSVGDEVWSGVLFESAPAKVALRVLRGKPDAVAEGPWPSEIATINTPSFAIDTSLAMAANGRGVLLAGFGEASFDDTKIPTDPWVWVRSEGATSNAIQLIDTSLNLTYRLAQESSMVSADGGSQRFWLSWAAIHDLGVPGVGGDVDTNGNGVRDCTDAGSDCAVAIASCNAATSDCNNAGSWNKLRLTTNQGLVFSTRILEVGNYVYVTALGKSNGPDKTGLLLWRCNLTTGTNCTSVSDFTGPELLKGMGQPILFLGKVEAPRLQLEAWDNMLYSAVTDYATGEVFLQRCLETVTNNCLDTSKWTTVRVLRAGDIRGQVDLGIVQGNVHLFVGRDATRAYILEPDTPAPLNRALLPNFAGDNLRASWTPRSLAAVDGYRADIGFATTGPTGATGWGSPTLEQSLAPDASAAELSLPGPERYGIVASYRGQDLGLAEPRFHAATGGRFNGGDVVVDASAVHYAETPECHIAIYAKVTTGGTKIAVATKPKIGNGSPTAVEVTTLAGAFTDLNGTATQKIINNRVHFAYVVRNGGTSDVRHDWRSVGADCTVDTSTPHDTLVGSYPLPGSQNANYLSMVINEGALNDSVYISYTQNDDEFSGAPNEMMLMRSVCTNVGTTCGAFAGPPAFAADYMGGALAISGTDLYWIWQLHGASNIMYTYAWRCNLSGPTQCTNVGDWPGSGGGVSTSAPVFPSVVDAPSTKRLSYTITVTGSALLVTSGFGHMAMCTLGPGDDCAAAPGNPGSSRAWNHGFWSPESLASFSPNLGMLALTNGVFSYVGLGNDGHGMARCRTRCWHPDNWFGGYTNRAPETGATLSGATHFGPIGSYSPATGKFGIVFHYRQPSSPRDTGFAFMNDVLFEYKFPTEP
ncbi:MAG: carboxypeptidase regulatory-like domain-containing protein [Deltaproteobacteria bacterium]|nr:carboxypeptidase regulatory-like domain-containing protein [Deltaproteobacteria bacterium]